MYHCLIRAKESLQHCYAVHLYSRTGPLWDGCLKILKRKYMKLHSILNDFILHTSSLVQYKLCLLEGFPLNQAWVVPWSPLVWLRFMPDPTVRKRDVLVSWLLTAGRVLQLRFGKRSWCFWLKLSTSVLGGSFLKPSPLPPFRYKTR